MKRALLLAITVIILFALWRDTGWSGLAAVCRQLDPFWFVLALAMFVPQTVVSAARWSLIVGTYQPLPVWRAAEHVLAASALNVVLPSKIGDVVKGAFLRRDLPGGDRQRGLMLGVFEKAVDVVALASLMLVATAWAPPTEPLGWSIVAVGAAGVLAFLAMLARPVAGTFTRAASPEATGIMAKLRRTLAAAAFLILHLRAHPRRLALILGGAGLLWALHLAQFSLALHAAGGGAGISLVWSRVPMAIFVGLLPMTVAGVGTRDAAMLYFLGPTTGPGVALALGVFATLRYVVVGLAGLPFVIRLPVPRQEPAVASIRRG